VSAVLVDCDHRPRRHRMNRATRESQDRLLKFFDHVIAFERDAHRLTRAELNKAIERARDLDDQLRVARNRISTIERLLASNAPASWRWSMSTSEGESSASN